MSKWILCLCAIASLTSCSGSAKVGYVLEGDWFYEGWRHSTTEEETTDVANVEVSPNGDGTYKITPGGCVG